MAEANKKELLLEVFKTASEMRYDRTTNKIPILPRLEMIIKKVFGSHSDYIDKIKEIQFSPTYSISGMDSSIYVSAFNSGRDELINLINVMIEDLDLNSDFEKNEKSLAKRNFYSTAKKIFIVHGHNEEMKQSTARFVEKIGFEAVILHEQASQGKTIIEKFTSNSDVSIAIVLLSADDLAINKGGNLKKGKFRARQNVILELGFFLGSLGRERVIVLNENVENFEIPSDYQGVIYIPFDSSRAWQIEVVKELKQLGFQIDSNSVF